MKKTILFLAIAVFALAGCGARAAAPRTATVITADFTKAKDTLDLAGILDDNIEIIPLETTDKSVVVDADDVWIIGDRVYVVDYESSKIAMFDRAGKFIKNIGRRGRGPREYLEMTSVEITDKHVLVLDETKELLFFYDLDGGFMRAVDVSDLWGMDVVEIKNKIYLLNSGSDSGKGLYALFELNNDGRYLGKALPFSEEIKEKASWSLDRCSSKNGDELMFYQPPYDSLFVMKGRHLKELYFIDFGARKVPEKVIDLGGREVLTTIFNEHYISGADRVQFTDKYIIISFREKRDYTAIYNRETKGCNVYNWLTNSHCLGLVYDMKQNIVRDDCWVGSMPANIIKLMVDHHEKYVGEGVVLSDFQRRMVALAATLDELDNPVIFVQKFKR